MAEATRLRRVSADDPGWTRRRHGRGFVYLDEHGERLAAADVARCRSLAIPPAWQDVWICPVPNGHLQAVGIDDAGRRQYLYHPEWRRKRDRAKHDRVLEVAARLPGARATVAEHLALPGMPKDRALATAFRLLDLGLFRVGGEAYAEENGSYGLATIEKRHVTVRADRVEFEYESKSGQLRCVAVTDPLVRDSVATLRRRRRGGPQLLAYRNDRTWHDITSRDINDYVKDVIGGDVSAKDFRTWHGTVLAALALAAEDEPPSSATARKRAVRRAVEHVSDQLGNTPAVARKSYIDPRVVDRYEAGETIEVPARARGEGARRRTETAVRRLLQD
jgi:DNA topoisomerase IB